MKHMLFLFTAVLILSCEKQIKLNTSDVPSAVITALAELLPLLKEWEQERS